jgi:protein associated with RNAse G/E
MVKIFESLLQVKYFTKGLRQTTEEMNPVYDQIDQKVNNEIAILKDNSINYLINMHPKFYRENLKFEDWDSSMKFLKDKKQEAFNFWSHDE